MRIAGGAFRGRVLEAPKGMQTRPTSDKIRQAVFNMLHSRETLENVQVLDVFCGTGALGLESLSRGAAHCLFIDKDREALACLRKNIEKLGTANQCTVQGGDALKIGTRPDHIPAADLLFLDPPYRKNLIDQTLPLLAAGGWLADGAWCVLECEKSAHPLFPDELIEESSRDYGDTKIILARYLNA